MLSQNNRIIPLLNKKYNETGDFKMNLNIDAKALVLDWMASEAFTPVNKHVNRQLGLASAFLLSETINQYRRWSKQNRLADGQFYWTEEDCEKETDLSKSTQHRTFKKMEELGLLKRHKKRINKQDAKTTRFIELYFEKIAEYMIQDDTIAKQKIAQKYKEIKERQKQYREEEIPKFHFDTSAKKAVKSTKFQIDTCRSSKKILAEVSKRPTRKNLSFSKKALSIKKENQSIKGMISQLELPGLITRVLEKNLERLIDSSIDLEGILIRYHKYEDRLPAAAFADVLRRTFLYFKKDFESYFDKSLEAELHSFASVTNEKEEKPAVRKAKSPDHLNQESKKMPEDEYLEKQKRLKDMLSKYKKQ